MKVLIISPCVNLPVPAVHGGAVSTLIEYLVKENEVEQLMDLTILSIYDAQAKEKAKEYLNTKIEFIAPIKVLEKFDCLIDGFLSIGKRKQTQCQYLKKLYSIRFIKKYMNEHDFDKVVFENSGYLLNVLKNKDIAKKYKGKLYYHLHNDIPNNVYISGVKQCKLLLISEYLKKHVNEVCAQDMSKQCAIVKNGFDCDFFAQKFSENEKQILRKKLGIAKDKKIIMFAGRIVAAKGIEELTQAFEKLDRNDVVLMVVGAHNFGTGQTSEFQKKMEKVFSRLGNRVCFTGFVPYDEIWKYYRIADVSVLPSMWEEPAGLTMLEACAAGIPLITTQSGGIPEYILDTESIILEKNDDIVNHITLSIEEVLNNSKTWKDKANRQQKYIIEHYNVKQYYNTFVNAMI